MGKSISVIINTLNEEKNIERAIKSVKWADEVVVCDMYSEDDTVKISQKLGAKIVFHKKTGYVEPARNFAIQSSSGEWILILDADEEVPEALADKLQELIGQEDVPDFVEIPRKNIIFGKWMQASFWWPDYNIRFFKKGTIKWKDEIHSKPETSGKRLVLPEEEKYAIIHYNYSSISQFVNRLDRYTTIQAKEIYDKGNKFGWSSFISKPVGEFLGRYFANSGYKDGVHGLALCLLQAFSYLIVYLKLWEMDGFKERDVDLKDLRHVIKENGKGLDYWFRYSRLSSKPIKRVFQKVWFKF